MIVLNILLQDPIFETPYHSTQGVPVNVQLIVILFFILFGLYVGYRVWKSMKNEKRNKK